MSHCGNDSSEQQCLRRYFWERQSHNKHRWNRRMKFWVVLLVESFCPICCPRTYVFFCWLSPNFRFEITFGRKFVKSICQTRYSHYLEISTLYRQTHPKFNFQAKSLTGMSNNLVRIKLCIQGIKCPR